MFFSLPIYTIISIYGLSKMSAMPLFIIWITLGSLTFFGNKLYRQTIDIPMGMSCAPLVADFFGSFFFFFSFLFFSFFFCYEKYFMKSLSRKNRAVIIEAFNSTSKYPDGVFNVDNIYFDQMVDRIYHTNSQINRDKSSDTEPLILFYLNQCISKCTVSTKINDKQDDFDFDYDLVNFSFLDGDVPRCTSHGVYIPQRLSLHGTSSNPRDFNYRNKSLLPNFLGSVIVILYFVNRFRNFIADTERW